MATRMLQRRGTSAEWAAENPVLADGELGFERDTKIVKLGDGVTPWNDLTSPYALISNVILKAGGTMTGPLSLIEPTEPAHAARLADLPADQDLSNYVTNDDGRLSDARTPLVHGIDKHIEKSEVVRSGKDSEGIFTVLEYNRPDGSRYIRSELSGGASPAYATRTVTWYDNDGITSLDTVVYDLVYDGDGDITEETVSV